MRKRWWKILCVVLLVYAFAFGLNVFNLEWFQVPRTPILNETIRNLYYHVGMWFSMMILFIISVVHAINFLRTSDLRYDILSRQYAVVGMIFGVLGYLTGFIWASVTWADPNQSFGASFGNIAREPKLIGAAIALLIYAAYLVLRDSVNDIDKKARISAVYNIFAFAFLFPSIWIIPRLLPSLHPGGEVAPGVRSDNPALDPKALTSHMRAVFYPAVLGWTLLGVWIATIKIRLRLIQQKTLIND